MRRGQTRASQTRASQMRRGHPSTCRERARLAARYAEQLYPGALGRLVAHELVAYAEAAPHARPGLVESVITEVLDRTAPRASGRRLL